MSREPKTTLPEDLLRSLNEQIAKVPDGFNVHRKLKPFLEKRRDGREGRLGPRRVAGVRLAAGARRADPPHRPGHRARHLQPAPPGAARRRDRRALLPAPEPAQRRVAVRAAQQPAVRAGLPGLRVRLLGAGLRRAGAVGGPVRRLRELRAGDPRPVPHLRPGQVGPHLAPHAAAAPRLRGLGPRALLGADRALPPGRRRGQHPRGQRDHARAVLPPAAPPGAGVQGAPAGGDDAQEPAAPARRGVDDGRAGQRRVPEGDRRRRRSRTATR